MSTLSSNVFTVVGVLGKKCSGDKCDLCLWCVAVNFAYVLSLGDAMLEGEGEGDEFLLGYVGTWKHEAWDRR